MSKKKKYTKPELEFVSFVLSSSIAATCALGHPDDDTNKSDDLNGWGDVDGNPYDDNSCQICYHVPTEGQNYFAS